VKLTPTVRWALASLFSANLGAQAAHHQLWCGPGLIVRRRRRLIARQSTLAETVSVRGALNLLA